MCKNVRRILMPMFALFVVVGLVGCATTVPAGQQVDDNAISAKVKSKITADPQLNPFEIDVDTQDGVVRLSGKVEKAEQRAEAEKLARTVEGVRGVDNDLELGQRTIGERVDDATITTRVKARLTDAGLSPTNIDVDTVDGVVTLSGRVKTEANRQKAAEVARDVRGVVRVENRLEVQS